MAGHSGNRHSWTIRYISRTTLTTKSRQNIIRAVRKFKVQNQDVPILEVFNEPAEMPRFVEGGRRDLQSNVSIETAQGRVSQIRPTAWLTFSEPL
jgi:hypothetical protein